jgi:hypothetical protein
MEQDEIQQLLENVRKEKDRLTRLEQQLQQQIVDKQGERARQDSAQDAAKRYRTSQVTRPAMADPETKRRILQSDEERRRQLLALQEKARLDYQKKLDEEKSKLEQNRRRWQQAQQARQESIRQDNASSGRKGGISVNIDKDAAKYDEGDAAALPKQTSAYFLPPRKEEPAPSQPPQRSYDKPEPAQSQPPQPQRGYDKPEPQQNEKAASDNDWKSKEKRRRAEKFVADIYKAMEKNQVKKARQIFDANRDYMSQYADLEVFNMVQQTIITAENAAAKAPSRTQASSERSSAYSSEADLPPQRTQTVQPPPVKERVVKPEPVVSRTETVVNAEVNWEGNELEYISRINGFVRDGNGKAAYKEFKKVEEQLKNYFTVEEFSHFKAMVENANSR